VTGFSAQLIYSPCLPNIRKSKGRRVQKGTENPDKNTDNLGKRILLFDRSDSTTVVGRGAGME
jgi:hypothetical protein